MARLGGGTVRVLPGTYRLRNAVYLPSNVRILGSGDDSVLIKEPSIKTKLAADSDWYDQEITLADAKGFAVGDGVCLQTKNPHNGGTEVAKRTLVARSGNRFKLDRALRQNFWVMGDSTCASALSDFLGRKYRRRRDREPRPRRQQGQQRQPRRQLRRLHFPARLQSHRRCGV